MNSVDDGMVLYDETQLGLESSNLEEDDAVPKRFIQYVLNIVECSRNLGVPLDSELEQHLHMLKDGSQKIFMPALMLDKIQKHWSHFANHILQESSGGYEFNSPLCSVCFEQRQSIAENKTQHKWFMLGNDEINVLRASDPKTPVDFSMEVDTGITSAKPDLIVDAWLNEELASLAAFDPKESEFEPNPQSTDVCERDGHQVVVGTSRVYGGSRFRGACFTEPLEVGYSLRRAMVTPVSTVGITKTVRNQLPQIVKQEQKINAGSALQQFLKTKRRILLSNCVSELSTEDQQKEQICITIETTPPPEPDVIKQEPIVTDQEPDVIEQESEMCCARTVPVEVRWPAFLARKRVKLEFAVKTAAKTSNWKNMTAARVRPFQSNCATSTLNECAARVRPYKAVPDKPNGPRWFHHLRHSQRCFDDRMWKSPGMLLGPKQFESFSDATEECPPRRVTVESKIFEKLVALGAYSQEEMESQCQPTSFAGCRPRYQLPPKIEVLQSTLTSNLKLSTVYRYLKPAKAQLKRSPIHGVGLFAAETLEKGDFVAEYFGEVIRESVCDLRERIYLKKGLHIYFFRIDKTDRRKSTNRRNTTDTFLDATLKGGPARFINHSCAPNSKTVVVKSEQKPHVLVIATRTIEIGDEILYDYSMSEQGEAPKIVCKCGSRRCRKLV